MSKPVLLMLISFGACVAAAAQAPPIEPEAGPRYPETTAREELPRIRFPRRNVWVSEYEPNSHEKQLLAPTWKRRSD